MLQLLFQENSYLLLVSLDILGQCCLWFGFGFLFGGWGGVFFVYFCVVLFGCFFPLSPFSLLIYRTFNIS